MSLRVLLADESSTIKKVMHLALQDFKVEVKAVPVGLDVLEVARNFKPDIIFADVMLTKKNGYEVSAEIKSDPELNRTPVVLMWSGFMEFDEAKAQLSNANQRLEKPFDTETLRKIVQECVPRLKTNLIANFLTFPKMPEFEEPAMPPTTSFNSQNTQTAYSNQHSQQGSHQYSNQQSQNNNLPPHKHETQIFDLDEPEEFESIPLPKARPTAHTRPTEDDLWSQQDIGQIKLEDVDSLSDLNNASIALSSGMDDLRLEDIDTAQQKHNSRQSGGNIGSGSLPSMTQISHERIEQIMREEVRQVLESIAWKILPDMTERIVREEIQKLMKDAERL